MNPELVDKTKKAIKLYMEEEQESRNTSITEQQGRVAIYAYKFAFWKNIVFPHSRFLD